MPSSLRHQVILSPHLSVGSGGADFHFSAGELVEEIRGAPGIDQFALAIDTHAGFGTEEPGSFGIIAIERASDFFVRADGIAGKARAILEDSMADIGQDCFRWKFWRR